VTLWCSGCGHNTVKVDNSILQRKQIQIICIVVVQDMAQAVQGIEQCKQAAQEKSKMTQQNKPADKEPKETLQPEPNPAESQRLDHIIERAEQQQQKGKGDGGDGDGDDDEGGHTGRDRE